MVRETAGTGAGAGVLVVVATVVVTVCVVVTVDGAVVWACADAGFAAAKKRMARNSFFTSGLDLGEIERFLILLVWCGRRGRIQRTGR